MSATISLLNDKLWVAHAPVGVPAYDFAFSPLFAVRHPYRAPDGARLFVRTGAFADYAAAYQAYAERGFRLVNDPAAHRRATHLSAWYPRIRAHTPRSTVFPGVPTVAEVERAFDYPVFIKGERQTAGHAADLCIARNRVDLERILAAYAAHPVLHWQNLVCRTYVPLRQVTASMATDKVPPSFEFRTFWDRGHLVGAGPYWAGFASYTWTEQERTAALRIGQRVANAVDVPFLVVDLAQTADGTWICIECNDAQESGYGGVNPIALWQNLIDRTPEDTHGHRQHPRPERSTHVAGRDP